MEPATSAWCPARASRISATRSIASTPDRSKIEALNAGRIPIFEPGLDDLVASNRRQGRLSFGMDLAAAVAEADAVFIAVGTPSRRGDGFADLSYVYAAARDIAEAMSR